MQRIFPGSKVCLVKEFYKDARYSQTVWVVAAVSQSSALIVHPELGRWWCPLAQVKPATATSSVDYRLAS